MSPTRWRRLARARRLFPLRLGGALLLAAALYVGLSFSPAQADYLLRPAALVALALVAACAVAVVAGALALRRAVARLGPGLPERLETRRSAATGFRLPRLRRWLILEVRVDWTHPEGVEVELERAGDWLEEYALPRRRGRFERVTRRFTVEDAFGLAAVGFDVAWPAPLRVVPARAACTAELASSRAQGDAYSHPAGEAEGDLVEMRQYADGDSMRHVLWKTYARTRRLLVRMPERALATRPLSVAFLVTGPGDEPSAGTARLYVETGLLGADFLFGADGAARPARSAAEAVEQIVDSAAARGDGGVALDALAAQIDPARLKLVPGVRPAGGRAVAAAAGGAGAAARHRRHGGDLGGRARRGGAPRPAPAAAAARARRPGRAAGAEGAARAARRAGGRGAAGARRPPGERAGPVRPALLSRCARAGAPRPPPSGAGALHGGPEARGHRPAEPAP